jgi:hypothetical protein
MATCYAAAPILVICRHVAKRQAASIHTRNAFRSSVCLNANPVSSAKLMSQETPTNASNTHWEHKISSHVVPRRGLTRMLFNIDRNIHGLHDGSVLYVQPLRAIRTTQPIPPLLSPSATCTVITNRRYISDVARVILETLLVAMAMTAIAAAFEAALRGKTVRVHVLCCGLAAVAVLLACADAQLGWDVGSSCG